MPFGGAHGLSRRENHIQHLMRRTRPYMITGIHDTGVADQLITRQHVDHAHHYPRKKHGPLSDANAKSCDEMLSASR